MLIKYFIGVDPLGNPNSAIPANSQTDLDAVERMSSRVGHAYFLFISLSAISCLLIFTKTDADLLFNRGSLDIPLLTSAPVKSGYLFLFAIHYLVFFFCQINLRFLWQKIGQLPVIFPDRLSLRDKLLNLTSGVMTTCAIFRAEGRRDGLDATKYCVDVFIIWILTPLTYCLLWCRYLRLHEMGISWGTLVGLVLICLTSLAFFVQFKKDISSSDIKFTEFKIWGTFSFLVLCTFVQIYVHCDNRTRYFLFDIDLRRNPISKKPEKSKLTPEDTRQLETVYLDGRDLRFGDFTDSFMAKVDFSGSTIRHGLFGGGNLHHANFYQVDLTGSRFFMHDKLDRPKIADLSGADLRLAILRDSHFEHVTLNGVRFEDATLANAVFREARMIKAVLKDLEMHDQNFNGCQLRQADFSGTKLWRVQFKGSNLVKTNFTKAHINDCIFYNIQYGEGILLEGVTADGSRFQNAVFKKAIMRHGFFVAGQMVSCILVEADLTGADFGYSNLADSDLSFAELRDTSFLGARLQNVSLSGARLFGTLFSESEGLTLAQVEKACIFQNTLLPASLWDDIGELRIMELTSQEWDQWIIQLEKSENRISFR